MDITMNAINQAMNVITKSLDDTSNECGRVLAISALCTALDQHFSNAGYTIDEANRIHESIASAARAAYEELGLPPAWD